MGIDIPGLFRSDDETNNKHKDTTCHRDVAVCFGGKYEYDTKKKKKEEKKPIFMARGLNFRFASFIIL